MQRNEIHLQITEVAEKIATLNHHLSKSSKIMKAETDLMNVYIDELKLLMNALSNTVAPTIVQPQEIKQKVVVEEKKSEPPVVIKEEVKVEKQQPEFIARDTEPIKHAPGKVIEPSTSKSLNERFTKKTVNISEKLQQTSSGKHLKDLISLSDKFMFVNELFKNDKNQFDTVVQKINELQSFDEAVQFIEDELKANFNWDKKQKTVEQFHQSIKKKFGSNN